MECASSQAVERQLVKPLHSFLSKRWIQQHEYTGETE